MEEYKCVVLLLKFDYYCYILVGYRFRVHSLKFGVELLNLVSNFFVEFGFTLINLG